MYIHSQLTYSLDLKVPDIAHNFVSAAFLCSGIEMLSEIVRLIYGKREQASACLFEFFYQTSLSTLSTSSMKMMILHNPSEVNLILNFV